MREEEGINTRNAEPTDYERIISVMPEWWGGRDLTALLPELFLVHFCDTSFVVERGAELIAFLVGFMSQSRPDEGYVHFLGVHPDFRKRGIGADLYVRFFEICRGQGKRIVRAQTSTVNTGSVGFHARLGFDSEHEDDKVSFVMHL